MRTMSGMKILAATGALALAMTACSGGGSSDSSSGDAKKDTTLTVFAAASLTDVYGTINKDFEKAHPGVKVSMTNGGSNDLVTQIDQGAPADVLATADMRNMDKAVEKGLIDGKPQTFATNDLVIAVAPGNPKKITSLKDLEKPDLSVVRCASEVPCGGVSDKVLKSAGVTLKPKSEEGSVTDVLGKVTSGDADAGLVYATDVKRSDGKTEAVTIPEAAEHRTQYPIAVVKDSKNKELAEEYVKAMVDEKAQKELADAGFGRP